MNDNPTPVHAEPRSGLLADTDLCVKCGYCLPHCPTYAIRRLEGESPRGRVALAQAIAAGQLAANPAALAHLSACLGCRACERICPSDVPYGRIIDRVQQLIYRQKGSGVAVRLINSLGVKTEILGTGLKVNRVLDLVLPVARAATGLAAFVFPGHFARLRRYFPETRPEGNWPAEYPVPGEARATAALFLGCVARLADADVLRDAVRVLNVAGVAVRIPQGQGCCGALPMHSGDLARARERVLANLDAFDAVAGEALITTASGCGAMLMEYPEVDGLNHEQREKARDLAARVQDISAFLNGGDWLAGLEFKPYSGIVAVHEPCSLRNVMGQQGHEAAMLGRIPGLEVVALPGNTVCCGAGGTQMITQPEMSDRLANVKVSALQETGAGILVTANVGCAMHLRAAVRDAGLDVEVLHPVSLIARQLVN